MGPCHKRCSPTKHHGALTASTALTPSEFVDRHRVLHIADGECPVGTHRPGVDEICSIQVRVAQRAGGNIWRAAQKHLLCKEGPDGQP